MELSFYGAGCVLVNTKNLQLLIDPPGKGYSGVKFPKSKVDVTLHTASQDGNLRRNGGFDIDSPGEYEIKTVEIQGIAAQLHIDKPEDPPRGVIYTVVAGDIHLLVIGNIAPQLNDEQIGAIEAVHVMAVPVGGHGLTLDANAAAKLVSQFEPSFVVPVHYDDGKTKYPVPQDKLGAFLKEVGGEGIQPAPKLKVTTKDLGEETKVVVLKRL
ncbi:MBL fold metallo-hydrolase [Candidatus Microgenomates bacterium]|nr:MBL fold metallo-hydrolase [Candidatus Microgenomates bacterium]